MNDIDSSSVSLAILILSLSKLLLDQPLFPSDTDFHHTGDQAVLAGAQRRAEPPAAHVFYVVVET